MSSDRFTVAQLLTEDSEADQFREVLREVIDPELGVDIVSLGLLYDIEVNGRSVAVLATTTTPACPLGDYISSEIERVLLASGMVDRVAVEITHRPPWTPEMMSESTKRAFGW